MTSEKRSGISCLTLGGAANRLTEPAVRSAIRALELPPGSKGMDAGCGLGNHTLLLAEAVAPGGHVTGIDIDDGCLSLAQENASKSSLKDHVAFKTGDIRKLPFDDDSFDWVWSADVLYLWLFGKGSVNEIAVPIMNELARVVKPGGTVALFFWTLHRLLPGHPLLEARLNATNAATFAGPSGIKPILHSSRALGWLQQANLKEPRAQSFVIDIQPPFDEETRETLVGILKMYWDKTKSEVSSEDWQEYQRLCRPDSSDFILDLPDYHGQIVYTLYLGGV
ncbi:MAG: class I SAM-dependent methyltransferase [Thermoplasmata archaeon]|nr:class I SAM-dependent methyltransferase [Thermoplasmata archaeon]